MFGYGSTLTVRRQSRDSDGDPTGPPTDTTSEGWRIAPESPSESDQRDAAALRLTCYRRGVLDVAPHPGDRVLLEVDGDLPSWQVVGWPQRWGDDVTPSSPFEGGAVVVLERVTG